MLVCELYVKTALHATKCSPSVLISLTHTHSLTHAVLCLCCVQPQQLIDNFDAKYGYVANEGTVFTFSTNLNAPKERIVHTDISADTMRPSEGCVCVCVCVWVWVCV